MLARRRKLGIKGRFVTPAPLRLDPATQNGIAALLGQSFGCINPMGSAIPTRASRLREYPSSYIGGMTSSNPNERQRYGRSLSQDRMDWAAWELARSILDESIKNSVGLLLFIDKLKGIEHDPVGQYIPDFDTKYVSMFSMASLYFCHFHAAMAGLSLSGLLIRDGRFLARDTTHTPRWKCINASTWEEDWGRASPRVHHEYVFQKYDSIQRHRVKWLPLRTEGLAELKQVREALTYKTQRMGGWSDTDYIDELRRVFPIHIDFQRGILNPVVDVVKNGKWNRSYNPKKRAVPLARRFSQYEDLANAVL